MSNRFDEFKEGEIIHEPYNKAHGIKAKPIESIKSKAESSKQDQTKNPLPFYLKLTPLITNIIRTQMNERMIDLFEATVDLTTSCADVFIEKMTSKYEEMSRMSIPLSKFSTANKVTIRAPPTEVFSSEHHQKEKMKVMVTSYISTTMHKYKDTFNIELADVFSGFVLESVLSLKSIDSDTRRNCEADLEMFYSHISKKVEEMSGISEVENNHVRSYLMRLAAMNVGQKTLNYRDFGYTVIIRSTKSGKGRSTRGKSPFKSGKNQYGESCQ